MSYFAFLSLKGAGYENVKNYKFGMAGWHFNQMPLNKHGPQDLGFNYDPNMFN